jgi:hypothetical protein
VPALPRKPTKIGVWKLILPLTATIIITGCAKNVATQETNIPEKQKRGDSVLVFQTGQVLSEVPKDTMQSTTVKLEGKALRDSLLKAHLDELHAVDRRLAKTEFPMVLLGAPIDSTANKRYWEYIRDIEFNSCETFLYKAGLNNDVKAIAQEKKYLMEAGEQYKQQERAEKIISNFDKIMQIE